MATDERRKALVVKSFDPVRGAVRMRNSGWDSLMVEEGGGNWIVLVRLAVTSIVR